VADGFTHPPPLKEVKLRIFIALKIPWPSAGFEIVNLGSSGKHDNHYTAENGKTKIDSSNGGTF
jgi:hypothetical protein